MRKSHQNTTDPEIDSVTWTKFGNNMAPLALVTNLAIRWRHLHHLQIWSPDGATCISCRFGHKMVPLALVPHLATRWHHLHYLQIWPPDGTTCISCKFGHQMAQLGLVQNLVIRWRHLHCLQSCPPGCITCIATLPWIALLALSVSIELVSSSARVTSVKSTQGLSLTHWRTDIRTQRSEPRFTWVR